MLNQEFWALKDVSFSIEQGEVVGIIGRNGAGKSTLLKIISRITAPTTGRIELYGKVGSLLEVGTGFHPELSGRENVFLNGAIIGMKRAEIQRKFDEIVAFAEVEKFLDMPVKWYSSGMYVRLAFAVAAHLEPEILIVDEVLAVGDATFQKKCEAKIRSVAQEGRTVLIVSHNMTATKSMCRRAILLNEGTIKDDGSPQHVVDTYQGVRRESRAEVEWHQPSQAPGTDVFRFCSVRLRDGQGAISSELKTHEPFSVEIEFLNLVPGFSLGATVLLFNNDGTLVFSSISNCEPNWHGKQFPAGLFRSVCEVPANFLPPGHFTVSVIIWGDNYTVGYREDATVEFDLEEGGCMRHDYAGDWFGVVRPLLKWTTQQIR